MFKKILLTSLLLFTFFGSISLGDCPSTAPDNCPPWNCNNYTYQKRYYNNEEAFTIRLKNNTNKTPTTYSLTQQKAVLKDLSISTDFTNYKDICKIQELMEFDWNDIDGKLGKNTIEKFLNYNFCYNAGMKYDWEKCVCQDFKTYNKEQNKCVCKDWYVDHGWACVKEAKEEPTPKANPAPQQTPKCWEHAYTCASVFFMVMPLLFINGNE